MNALMNFLYGIYALAHGLSLSIKGLIEFQLLWGFIFGLTIATLIYAIVLTKEPKPVCISLSHEKETHPFRWTLTGLTCMDPHVLRYFSTTRDKVIFVANLTFVTFLGIIFIALVFF